MANDARIRDILERSQSLPMRAPELPPSPTSDDIVRHCLQLSTMYADLALAFHEVVPLLYDEIVSLREEQRVAARRRRLRPIR